MVESGGANTAQQQVEGELVDVNGAPFYRITNYDAMLPFFMSIVSDSDHWMFLSSEGGLTAGRRDPDHALFPYYTDDRIHDGSATTGPLTVVRAARDGVTSLWEPFSKRQAGTYSVERTLYKSTYGNQIIFEETNRDLELVFQYSWANSERFGWVRRSEIRNTGVNGAAVEILDGVQNVLPASITRRFQLEYSTLVDGYKRTELAEGTRLALFRLSSIPVDNAEPSEALRVNTAWTTGLDSPGVLLSAIQLDAFRAGGAVEPEEDIRGRRGAYMVHASLALAAGESRDWLIALEVALDAVGVRALMAQVDTPSLKDQVLADIGHGTSRLIDTVARADGLQTTGDRANVSRHFANTMFNVMRGGIPDDGYRVSRADLTAYLAKTNRPVAQRQAEFLAALPESILRSELLERVAQQGDLDLERLATEYLPFAFSRRHGDPSRPWNTFSIQVKDEHGNKTLNYQGNWRDIFQNWEALAYSYPGFTEGMIFKFLDSTTADGYNPYRVLREGFEWELVDPTDDWAHIGYWGDHQVVYLLRLLEVAQRHEPGALTRLLTHKVFTFADVPYRIRSYAEMIEDPRNTIDFDHPVNEAALARAEAIGSDGKALVAADGELARANLTEKMLIVALSKLTNFVPEAGIWLNTQRPEWNDANNALVGNGVSMVTLSYLRRYVATLDQLVANVGVTEVEVSEEVADFFAQMHAALTEHAAQLGAPIADAHRRAALDAFGMAGEAYRTRVYAGSLSGATVPLSVAAMRDFCAVTLRHLDHTVAANRREDGLYHSYNIMRLEQDGIGIGRLSEMLEGQVAVLSAGVLNTAQVLDVLDALRGSALYRADQRSYILYPDRELPHFLDKNTVPAQAVSASALLTAMLEKGDPRIVAQDVDGGVHFDAAFRNRGLLGEALDALADGPHAELAASERDMILATYEDVFQHASFTGRSGTFYKYEGLGSIYWHMVSKLLLAVDEALLGALAAGEDAETVDRLRAHYEEIREGIGSHKSPAEYGAVPTDPYSHTPGFSGVQQPGMTGQVKEDVLTRLSEMGVTVTDGRVSFVPARVAEGEFLAAPGALEFVDVAGEMHELALEPGTMAFTLCQVPVVLHRGGDARVEVTYRNGTAAVEALLLDSEVSAAVFGRTGEIAQLDVYCGLGG